MEILPQPLTKQAFTPFGELFDIPQAPGRAYHDEWLGDRRAGAKPSLSLSLKPETPDRPVRVEMLERHEFSSQSFVPLDVGRWLIVVAPHAPRGGPDLSQVRAFIADGQHGITYKSNTWHHGLTTLDRPGRFAIFMWRDGGKDDEEFVPVEPFTIRIT